MVRVRSSQYSAEAEDRDPELFADNKPKDVLTIPDRYLDAFLISLRPYEATLANSSILSSSSTVSAIRSRASLSAIDVRFSDTLDAACKTSSKRQILELTLLEVSAIKI